MNRPLRILVVDDNPQDRTFVVHELRNEFQKAETWEATTEPQFALSLQGEELDLVVTDYQLQWSDGIAILNRVKAIWPDCPVIMFTECANEEIEMQGRRNGMDDYVVKNAKHRLRLRAATRSVLDHAATLKRAEELSSRLGSLLSQLRIGVFSCRPDGDLLETNQAMRGLFSSLGANPSENLSALSGGDASATRRLEQVLRSEALQECEFEVLGKNGATRCLRLSIIRVNCPAAFNRIDGLLEDVTERKRSEAMLRDSMDAAAKIDVLSPREEQVMGGVVQGNANKVIARRLGISEKTVEKHRSNIMKKLRIRSVPELVRLAMVAKKKRPLARPET